MDTSLTIPVRTLQVADAAALADIDEAHSGRRELDWWQDVVARHARPAGSKGRVGVVALDPQDLGVVLGYLLGQVRAFEFGSEPCGWVYSVGVHPTSLRCGVATALFQDARRRFARLGVRVVRTMVKRDDVEVLSFFRSQGFRAGPYVEMERLIEEPEPDR